MTRITPLTFAVLLGLGLPVAPAYAQLARTYVSAKVGNDGSDCNRLTPCRTFQVAHDKTLANGEITVLDPGGYGAVTINKTISIINDGVGEAGVLVSGGAIGITISAGASDKVSLRGLTIKGIGFGGGNGIVFDSGKSLTVENCVIRNLTGSGVGTGILFRPNASSSLAVSNTLVSDNSGIGLQVRPAGAGITVKAVFNRVGAYNNVSGGISVAGGSSTGTINATAVDSVADHNGVGFSVSSFTNQAATTLTVVRSVASNGIVGIRSLGAGAIARVGHSTITGNFTGIEDVSAVLLSYGDNTIDGNGTNGTPATTPLK
jgi:hypothetical protein